MAAPLESVTSTSPFFVRTNAKNTRFYLSGMPEFIKKKRTNSGPLPMPSKIQRYADALLQGCVDTVGAFKVKRFF